MAFIDAMNRLVRATHEAGSRGAIAGGALGGTAGLIGSQLADAVFFNDDPEAKPGLMRRGLTVGAPLLGALAGAMLANRMQPVDELDDDTRRDAAVSEPLLGDLAEFVTSTS